MGGLTPGAVYTSLSSLPTPPRATPEQVKEKFQQLLKERVEAASGRLAEGTSLPIVRREDDRIVNLGKKVDDLLSGIPVARDGQYIITTEGLKDIRTGFHSMAQELVDISGTRTLTFEESNTLKKIQQQINSIDLAMSKAGRGDVIARVNLGIGQIKGEALIVGPSFAEKYRDPVTGLLPHVITDIENIKKEVGSDIVRNILLDVGDESPEVFSDPLMFLYHDEYFTRPEFRRTMIENARMGFGQISAFEATADIPEEVRNQLLMDLSDEMTTRSGQLGVPFSRLDPLSRSTNLRMRREAEDIVSALRAGEDPRNIPALVRRIADYHLAGVVRYKDGRTDMVMPTANRFNIRTFESHGAIAQGFSYYDTPEIDPSAYGLGPMRSRARSVRTDDLKLVQFRVRGKDMLLAGDAARLYKATLGGFDLDDKGIPLMSTFVDKSGARRLAFFTLRQPTSFQESLMMSADFTDAGTIQSVFKNNKRFVAALEDSTYMSSVVGVDPSEREALGILRQSLGGGYRGRISRNQARKIEQLSIKIMESERVGNAPIPGLTTSQVVQMLMTQSPSTLGLDSIETGSKLFNLLRDSNIDISQGVSPYSSDVIFQIFREKGQARIDERVVAAVQAELGIDVAKDEIAELLDGTGPRYTQGMEHRISAAIKTVLEDVQREAAGTTIEDSIGVFINRQSSSIFALSHARRTLAGADYEVQQILAKTSSIFTLPGSEAVDITKQISLEQFLSTQGAALQNINARYGVDDNTVVEVLQAYMEHMFKGGPGGLTDAEIRAGLAGAGFGEALPLKLDPIGKQMLRSMSAVGVTRAEQILQQVRAPGFARCC